MKTLIFPPPDWCDHLQIVPDHILKEINEEKEERSGQYHKMYYWYHPKCLEDAGLEL